VLDHITVVCRVKSAMLLDSRHYGSRQDPVERLIYLLTWRLLITDVTRLQRFHTQC